MERPLMRLILRTTLKKYYPLLLLSLHKIDFAKRFGKPSFLCFQICDYTNLYQECNLSEITEIFAKCIFSIGIEPRAPFPP